MKHITTPLTIDKIEALQVGEEIRLSGIIYTGRDAVHKRLLELIQKQQLLPFDIQDQTIFYVGPTPAKPDQIFGSSGPTTSGRMDEYAPTLISLGLRSMIGKGYRNASVKEAIIKYKGIYLGAIGGAGAFTSTCIVRSELIAFKDLGPEAIYKLEVKDMPLVVIIDCLGKDWYEIGQQNYLHTYK
jgi:fumarate hydratase subunit beta